jgi:hypothetical protein
MQMLILIFPLMAALLDQGSYIHTHKFHHQPEARIMRSYPLPIGTEIIYFVSYSKESL